MGTLWFAYIIAYSIGSKQFTLPAGADAGILENLGPHGLDKAACMAYADSQRQRVADAYKLPDRRILKYDCAPVELAKF